MHSHGEIHIKAPRIQVSSKLKSMALTRKTLMPPTSYHRHLALWTLLNYPRGKVEHLFKANETCSVLRAVDQRLLQSPRSLGLSWA